MYQSASSLGECIIMYVQEEITNVLLHPHLNIVFWATNYGVVGSYEFHNEV